MRRVVHLTVLALTLILPRVASAATLTFVPPDKDLGDLDHHYVYTWRVLGAAAVIPAGHVITGAKLYFDDIRDSDSDPGKLFVHLLDASKTSASVFASGTSHGGLVQQTVYRAGDTGAAGADEFAGAPLSTPLGTHSRSTPYGIESWVVGALGDAAHSFTKKAEDYIYDFSDAQIADLRAYLASGGDWALALDPDSDFSLDGIKLVLTTAVPAAVPEPTSLTLLGLGLAGIYARRRKSARR